MARLAAPGPLPFSRAAGGAAGSGSLTLAGGAGGCGARPAGAELAGLGVLGGPGGPPAACWTGGASRPPPSPGLRAPLPLPLPEAPGLFLTQLSSCRRWTEPWGGEGPAAVFPPLPRQGFLGEESFLTLEGKQLHPPNVDVQEAHTDTPRSRHWPGTRSNTHAPPRDLLRDASGTAPEAKAESQSWSLGRALVPRPCPDTSATRKHARKGQTHSADAGGVAGRTPSHLRRWLWGRVPAGAVGGAQPLGSGAPRTSPVSLWASFAPKGRGRLVVASPHTGPTQDGTWGRQPAELWPSVVSPHFFALRPTSPLLRQPLFPRGGTGACPGKPQVLGWGLCPLYPGPGGGGAGRGRRGSGPMGAAGRPPRPLPPTTPPPLPLEAGGMEEGREPAWGTGHPLGRTQDARPEVPSPGQGHRGTRSPGPEAHWV